MQPFKGIIFGTIFLIQTYYWRTYCSSRLLMLFHASAFLLPLTCIALLMNKILVFTFFLRWGHLWDCEFIAEGLHFFPNVSYVITRSSSVFNWDDKVYLRVRNCFYAHWVVLLSKFLSSSLSLSQSLGSLSLVVSYCFLSL